MSTTVNNPETIVTRSAAETMSAAARFAGSLGPRAVIALHGDLGSGKTCFVRGMAAALGIHHSVTSPTFTLIHEYHGNKPLYHIDLYRLNKPDELAMIGFEEYLDAKGVVVVEWAERGSDLLPPDTIHVTFTVLPEPDSREITITWPRA